MYSLFKTIYKYSKNLNEIIIKYGSSLQISEEHKNISMTDEVEDKLVKFISSNEQAKQLTVTWFGGEPLLEFKRIVSLTKKMQALNLDYQADMITNGYLLTEKVVAMLPSLSISSLQITINGMKAVHDSRRCLKLGAPTFDRIYVL